MGQNQVKAIDVKVKAISDFSVPSCRTQLMRCLGMAGFYRRFCKNLSIIAKPLKIFYVRSHNLFGLTSVSRPLIN